MPIYRVLPVRSAYQIGYGPDNEFIVVAYTYSKVRAEQIARLLNTEGMPHEGGK